VPCLVSSVREIGWLADLTKSQKIYLPLWYIGAYSSKCFVWTIWKTIS